MFIPPVGLAAGALFFKQEGQKERGNKTVRETFPKQKPLARTRSKSERERKTPDTESRAGGVGRGTFAVVRVVHRFIFRATRKEIIVATTLQSVFRRRKHVRQLRRGGGGGVVRGVVVAVGTEFRAGHDRRAGGVRDVREGHYSASLLSVGAFERNAMCVDKAKSVSLVLFFSRFFPFFFFFFSFFSFPQHEKKKTKEKKRGWVLRLFCFASVAYCL